MTSLSVSVSLPLLFSCVLRSFPARQQERKVGWCSVGSSTRGAAKHSHPSCDASGRRGTRRANAAFRSAAQPPPLSGTYHDERTHSDLIREGPCWTVTCAGLDEALTFAMSGVARSVFAKLFVAHDARSVDPEAADARRVLPWMSESPAVTRNACGYIAREGIDQSSLRARWLAEVGNPQIMRVWHASIC